MSAEATLAASSFDADQPAAFYLLDNREGMEALSDATLVVQGVELPVHSQVLSQQSRVLLDMFTSVTSKMDSKAVLKEPFVDCTVPDVALFLRFVYRPTDLTPANLTLSRGSLLGVLRLAHKLDAPQITTAVQQEMHDAVRSVTQAELLAWAEAAEQCGLRELHLRCLTEVARRLACDGGDSLAAAFSNGTGMVTRCDRSTLATLLGLLAKGSSKNGASRLQGITPAAAVEALEASANHGSFEWAIDRFSQLPAEGGKSKLSPFFPAAGIKWRLQLYPGGKTQESAGAMSVYIIPEQGGFTAKWSIAVRGQNGAKHERASGDADMFVANHGWGFPKFIETEQLRTHHNGFLKGDRLVLRASVEVKGRDVQPMAE